MPGAARQPRWLAGSPIPRSDGRTGAERVAVAGRHRDFALDPDRPAGFDQRMIARVGQIGYQSGRLAQAQLRAESAR